MNVKIAKTTVELDENKLERVMALTGLKTRKDALDYALTEAVRIATLADIKANPISAAVLRDAVDPDYDVLAMRRLNVRYGRSH